MINETIIGIYLKFTSKCPAIIEIQQFKSDSQTFFP